MRAFPRPRNPEKKLDLRKIEGQTRTNNSKGIEI